MTDPVIVATIAGLSAGIGVIASHVVVKLIHRHRINQLQQQPRKGETHGSGLGFHVQHGELNK